MVVSDVEMGAGGPRDDFPQSDHLGRLLAAYGDGAYREVPITIVFNGDTFDLLKTSHRDGYPTRIDADVAVAKLLRVTASHPGFFEHLRRFLRGDRARRLAFVVGNHDLELAFPEVQAILGSLFGAPEQVLFPGQRLQIGDVRIEHGFQADPVFTADPEAPFVEEAGRTILNLPWGAVALLEVAMPLSETFYPLDRLRPRRAVLDMLPEVRELLLAAFWRYWTRDYWRDFFADADPLKRVSWTMLKEVVYRLGTHHADVSMGDHYQRQLARDPDTRLLLVGHQHEPGWWSENGRKVLRTGCFRNEYLLTPIGTYEPLPKVYAEVFLRDQRVVRSHLVEITTPEPPPGFMPPSLEPLRAEARRLLARSGSAAEIAARGRREAEEAAGRGLALEGDAHLAFFRSLRQALRGGAD